MSEHEHPEVRAIVFKYWRWFIDAADIDDRSDTAKTARAYMRKIAEQAYSMGEQAATRSSAATDGEG